MERFADLHPPPPRQKKRNSVFLSALGFMVAHACMWEQLSTFGLCGSCCSCPVCMPNIFVQGTLGVWTVFIWHFAVRWIWGMGVLHTSLGYMFDWGFGLQHQTFIIDASVKLLESSQKNKGSSGGLSCTGAPSQLWQWCGCSGDQVFRCSGCSASKLLWYYYDFPHPFPLAT